MQDGEVKGQTVTEIVGDEFFEGESSRCAAKARAAKNNQPNPRSGNANACSR